MTAARGRTCTAEDARFHLEPLSNRQYKRLLAQSRIGASQRHFGVASIANGAVCSPIRASRKLGHCALHSASKAECGGIMGHIEEQLLRTATTKGSPNQLPALHSLRLLIQSDPDCIKDLRRFDMLDLFTKVLQQPYQKSVWELMNSYIWSASSAEHMQLKTIQDTVLATLIMIARRDEATRSSMARDEHFKSLLMRIYICEMKRKEGDPLLLEEAQGLSSNSNTSVTSGSDGSDASSNYSDQSESYSPSPESCLGDPQEAYAGSGATKATGITRWDTQQLVHDLFQSFGYEINENTVMERFQRALDSEDANESALCDTGSFVAHCEGFDGAVAVPEDSSEGVISQPGGPAGNFGSMSTIGQDTQPGEKILWIPYVFRRKEGDEVSAIQRYLSINLGEALGPISNMDELGSLTVNAAEGDIGDVVYGMVALSKGLNASNYGMYEEIYGSPSIPTSVAPTVSPVGSALQPSGDGYSVISNIRVAKSEHLNGPIIAANLLQDMRNTTSLKVFNDIFHELWTLVGSQEKGVLDLVHRELDLRLVAEVIERSLPVEVPSTHFREEPPCAPEPEHGAIYNILTSVGNMVRSYISAVIPIASGASDDHFKAAPEHEGAACQRGAIVIGDATVNGTYTHPNEEDARRLQTTVFGLLIDMVYLDGKRSLKLIRECAPLVAALKRARETFPLPVKLVDVLDSRHEHFYPLLDRRRNDIRNETRVIHNECEHPAAGHAEELLARKRDEFGNILSDIATWTHDSWMRQRYTARSAVGPVFNGNKLLNILGHHDQRKFEERGLRILSIDGGGSKGVIALEILRDLEDALGKPLHEAFDLMCGTSCGGLLAALMALEKARVPDIQKMFELIVSQVFTRDSYHVMGTRLFMKQAYYDENVLCATLRQCFGNTELIDYSADPTCPKFFCLSVQMDTDPMKPIVWRNYNYPPEAGNGAAAAPHGHLPMRDGSFAIHTADAIRATTAAPMYFPVFERNGNIYGDGALHSNNPSLLAVLESGLLYPGVPIDCLVSVGTGNTIEGALKRKAELELAGDSKRARTADGAAAPSGPGGPGPTASAEGPHAAEADANHHPFDVQDVLLRSLNVPMANGDAKSLGLDRLINHLISSATNTEVVHSALHTLMDTSKYFRFNPPVQVVRLDDTNPEVLADLKAKTRRYLEQERQVRRMASLKSILGGGA